MQRRLIALSAAALLTGACGGGSASGSAPATRTTPARGSSNVITDAEVAAAGVTTALDAVQRLRPTMLRGRGGTSASDQSGSDALVVYVDGVRAGGVEALGGVTALTVKEIRFISASDATTRFGTGHPVGAILVATKR